MSNENEDFLTIDPDLGRRPILPAGDYEAVLDRCDVRDSRFQRDNPGMKADHFEVVVRHPEFGIVRLFADKDRIQGTIAVKWFNQLGISNDELKSGFKPSTLSGTPVLVTVGVREYINKEDERVQQNTIKNLVRLS